VIEIEDAVDAADELAPLTDAIAAALPSGWKLETLGSLCEKSQYGWTTKADKDGQGVKFLRTTDITPGVVDWERVPFCVEAPPDLEKYLIREGDLLISRTGSIGVNYLVSNPEPAVFASYLIRFRPKKSISTKYLRHYLQSPTYWRAIAAGKKGIAVQNVNATMLSKIPVPVAPDSEQTEIVAEIEKQFSRLDQAVANLQRVMANLKRYKDSVYAEVFGNKPNCTLGDLIDEGPQNGLYLPKEMYGEGVPILRIDDYQTAWIRPLAELRRVKATQDQIATWALREDDLVINRVNSMTHLGKCALVPAPLAGTVFESNMMRMRLKTEVSPKYVEHYLSSRLGKTRLTENAKWAVNQASINQKDVRATPIFIPDLFTQQQIVADIDRRLSIIKGTEVEVQANIKRAQALRQSTLNKVFGAA
jgi:type I restriction enzyme S subunit